MDFCIHFTNRACKPLEIQEARLLSGSIYMLIDTGIIYGEKGTKDINTYHIMMLDFEQQEIH